MNSCKKNSTEFSQKILEDKEIISLVKGKGELHNKSLENIKETIIKLRSRSAHFENRSTSTFNPSLPDESTVKGMMETNAYDCLGFYEVNNEQYTFSYEETYAFLEEVIYGEYFNQTENTDYLPPLHGVHISDELVTAKDNIYETLMLSETSEDLRVSLESMEEDLVASVIDFKEKLAVAGMIEIAIHSFEYWEENYDSWAELFGDPQYMLRNNDNIKSAVWTDIGGAATGAIKGAIKGTVFGAFYGAAVGGLWGMVTGAIGASAGGFVSSTIKSWIWG